MYIAQQCCIPLDKRNTGGGMREGGMRKTDHVRLLHTQAEKSSCAQFALHIKQLKGERGCMCCRSLAASSLTDLANHLVGLISETITVLSFTNQDSTVFLLYIENRYAVADLLMSPSNHLCNAFMLPK